VTSEISGTVTKLQSANADALPHLPPVADPNNDPDPDDRAPPRVAALWFAQEADVPPWRMESSEERERREELESAGVRWPQAE
jgi:hypothetical protein